MKAKTINILLIAIGVALLCVGVAYPTLKTRLGYRFATVVADDTPPYWMTDAGSNPILYPLDGRTYASLHQLSAYVADPESGVASVVCTIDGTAYPLNAGIGDPYTGQMYLAIIPEQSVGQHTFRYVATNTVGLTCEYSGIFAVSAPFQGKWYVSSGSSPTWVEVTSPTQTYYSSSLTINFKFVKTAGPSDGEISCKIVEGAQSKLLLTNSEASTWTGTMTVTGGKHQYELRAAVAGGAEITFAVLDLNFGGQTVMNEQLLFFGSGGCLIGFGAFRLSKKRA